MRAASVPVFYVQHNDEEFITGSSTWEINPSITPNEGEVVIQKHTPDSFHETDLHEKLQASKIQNLIIAGNQTEYCIDKTIRLAFSLGYNVILVKDAHRTFDTTTLTAKQIIEHHNRVLEAFAILKMAEDVQF